jgi:prepilin-type N-terminal cleavage/methylation domain-containing protein
MLTSQRGVTLAELLVVVAIVAILGATLLVQFGRSRQQADDARAIALAHQLRMAIVAYEVDTGSFAGLPHWLWPADTWNSLRSVLGRVVTLPPWSAVAPTIHWMTTSGGFYELAHEPYIVMIWPVTHGTTTWHYFVGTPSGVYRCDGWGRQCRKVR